MVPKFLAKDQVRPYTFVLANLILQLLNLGSIMSSKRIEDPVLNWRSDSVRLPPRPPPLDSNLQSPFPSPLLQRENWLLDITQLWFLPQDTKKEEICQNTLLKHVNLLLDIIAVIIIYLTQTSK